MDTASKECLRFVPSRVEGLPNVTEVVVFPDRLEFMSDGRWVVIRLADIANWPRPKRLRRLLAWFGWQPKWLPVADRDWFHPPPDRFFRFYTSPPIVVYMPVDDLYAPFTSIFGRLQEILRVGGYASFDLG